MSISGRTPRQQRERSNPRSAQGASCLPEEAQKQQPPNALIVANQEPKSPNRATPLWLPKDYKQTIDTFRQVVCISLAAWMLIQTRDVWQFSCILAAGYITPRGAKDVLVKLVKAVATESK